MQAAELSHLFFYNASNAAPKAGGAKSLQDIVYSYMVTTKMKLKEASAFYLQLSRHFTVQMLHTLQYNLHAILLP